MKKTPISRKDGIVVQETNGELLIYDLTRNKALCLNEVAAAVWKACDGTNDIGHLKEMVNREFSDRAGEEFIWLALDQLRKENLLQDVPEMADAFNGFSRREAIKKIGFSSMVALPVVTSLIAPSAAHAQSVACGTNIQCQCVGLGNVTSCPGNVGGCPNGCSICTVTSPCFLPGGEGSLVCNGVCGNAPQSTCPPSNPGDCTCFGTFSLNQTCAGVQCASGCSSCRVTTPCITQEVGPPACNGVCQQ